MDKIIIEIETQTVFSELSAMKSISAFQARQGNYCGRPAVIVVPGKGQNGNCWFVIQEHHLAQQAFVPLRNSQMQPSK